MKTLNDNDDNDAVIDQIRGKMNDESLPSTPTPPFRLLHLLTTQIMQRTILKYCIEHKVQF